MFHSEAVVVAVDGARGTSDWCSVLTCNHVLGNKTSEGNVKKRGDKPVADTSSLASPPPALLSGLGQTAGGAEEKPGHGIYKSVALRLLYQTSMEEQQTPQLKNSGVTAIASLAEAR
ncbi:hypothetical protein KUCAC02_007546 [Chaenocephalus aceratus]|uniref:Uncharacterized protein n=1 Tax=Chaenocephalus aceratus TaxID=36190 RepID=A0ACB9X5V4_CHAAC|nr:hypothetical protein KUCAC02_007546 [Chaenocephalus aceratus]